MTVRLSYKNSTCITSNPISEINILLLRIIFDNKFKGSFAKLST